MEEKIASQLLAIPEIKTLFEACDKHSNFQVFGGYLREFITNETSSYRLKDPTYLQKCNMARRDIDIYTDHEKVFDTVATLLPTAKVSYTFSYAHELMPNIACCKIITSNDVKIDLVYSSSPNLFTDVDVNNLRFALKTKTFYSSRAFIPNILENIKNHTFTILLTERALHPSIAYVTPAYQLYRIAKLWLFGWRPSNETTHENKLFLKYCLNDNSYLGEAHLRHVIKEVRKSMEEWLDLPVQAQKENSTIIKDLPQNVQNAFYDVMRNEKYRCFFRLLGSLGTPPNYEQLYDTWKTNAQHSCIFNEMDDIESTMLNIGPEGWWELEEFKPIYNMLYNDLKLVNPLACDFDDRFS